MQSLQHAYMSRAGQCVCHKQKACRQPGIRLYYNDSASTPPIFFRRQCRTKLKCTTGQLGTDAVITAENDVQAAADTFLNERGVKFVTGRAFYRAESAQGRDLAVLAASVYRKCKGQLRVLDVMSGSGVRGARYLKQAHADEMWCNDFNSSLHKQIMFNLHSNLADDSATGLEQHSITKEDNQGDSQGNHASTNHPMPGSSETTITRQPASLSELEDADSIQGVVDTVKRLDMQATVQTLPGLKRPVWEWEVHHKHRQQHVQDTSEPTAPRTTRVRVSHMDAKRLLTAAYLNEDYFDLIDIDSFGSESAFLGNAMEAVKFGGLLYLTSTDGMSSGGRTPLKALAAYGCYTRALPFANEQGLRMLIGAAVQEGATRGLTITPVFSLYSHHGPVFRVMLRVTRSALWPSHHLKFAGHCHVHGHTRVVDWADLGHAQCRCIKPTPGKEPASLSVAGPMWTGPLHNHQDLLNIQQEAQHVGWVGGSIDDQGSANKEISAQRTKKNSPKTLEDLLEVLLEEADEQLPPGFTPIDVLGRYMTSYPPRDKLLAELRRRGFAAARCHLDSKSLRTNAPISQLVSAAAALGIQRRMDCPWPADTTQ